MKRKRKNVGMILYYGGSPVRSGFAWKTVSSGAALVPGLTVYCGHMLKVYRPGEVSLTKQVQAFFLKVIANPCLSYFVFVLNA